MSHYYNVGKAIVDHLDASAVAVVERKLGNEYSKLGFHELALTYIRRAKQCDPLNPDSFRDLAMFYKETGDFAMAFFYLLIASLLLEKTSAPELTDLSRSLLNSECDNKDVYALYSLIGATILIVENTKYYTLWTDSINRFAKIKEYQNGTLVVESLILLCVYVHRKTGIFARELDQRCIQPAISRVPIDRVRTAMQLYYNTFGLQTSLSFLVGYGRLSGSDLSILLYPNTVWTLIDADSLIENFGLIKELVYSAKLRLLITLEVLRDLDKKESRSRRSMDVLFYLDNLLSHGSKAIRFQTLYEWNNVYDKITLGDLLDGGVTLMEAVDYYANFDAGCTYEIWSSNRVLVGFAEQVGFGISLYSI